MTTVADTAREIIRANDRGGYTVPTDGLYPFQWNWDSCLTALGQAQSDEARAWTEIVTLFDHQWPDGMVPHIVFHQDDPRYFPGPAVWRTDRPVPTSGITQPPVAGFVLRRLFERAGDRELAERQVRQLLPRVAAWHEWFHRCRDPAGTGLVAILHPWESGRDNSVDWDKALARVPDDGIDPYVRKDTTHVNAQQRPTRAEYDRFIWLVQHFRSLGWDNARLHDSSPFRVVDPAFNAILIRSEDDLAWLAGSLGQPDLAARQGNLAAAGRRALDSLWSDRLGQYVCFDRAAGASVDSASIGGLVPLFAGASRWLELVQRLRELLRKVKYAVPSHDPGDARFDSQRYWRGPVWLIVNYLIIDGLRAAGENGLADEIVDDSLSLAETGGLAEYYDPHTGEGLGGGTFTWTAAMVLEFQRLRQR